jgi:inorganic pyrophosphatase
VRGHPWHDVPLNDDLGAWFPVFVEINRGSRVKYELDKPTGLLRVDRVLYGAVHYPASYGFVPRTFCPDGDPLDALVLCQEELVPGVLLRARAVGVLRTRDERGQDDKLIAVHVDDPFLAEIRELTDLSAHEVAELRRFLKDYKALEGKPVAVDETLGRQAALTILREAAEQYLRKRGDLLDPARPGTTSEATR